MSKRTIVLAIGAILALVVTVQVAAFASHPEVSLPNSNFEIDTNANLKVDDPAPSIDWASVTETRKPDLPTGSGDDSFGQGTKEDTAVPTVVDGSIPPNKSDLLTFGVYLEETAAGDFLNLYWHRVQEPSGTTNMDFEFNQSEDLSANGKTPVRTAGDVLIQYDLSQGGTNPVLFVSRWVTTGDTSQCEASNRLPCWSTKTNLTTAGDATGSINTSAIPAAESDGLGDISPRTFGEAQVDFDAIQPPGNDCTSFGSAYLKSRSSDSFTAALKDFIAPTGLNLDQCGTVIIRKDTNPEDTDEVGTTGPQFNYNATGVGTPATFSLGDEGVQTYNSVPFGTGKTVTETLPPPPAGGWAFLSVDCSASTGVTPTTTPNNPLVTFAIDDPDDILDCTYTNELRSTGITSTQSFIPLDSATITGDPPDNFDGRVEWRLYSGNACAGETLFEDLTGANNELTDDVSGVTKSTENDGTATAGTKDGYTITGTGGTFSWKVDYVPDAGESHPAQTLCKEVSTLTINNNFTPPTQ